MVALSGLKRPFEARITGKGDWTLWRGDALLALAGGRPSRLGIEQRRGHYRLDGTIEADVLGGLAHRAASPRVALVAEGTLADRIPGGTRESRVRRRAHHRERWYRPRPVEASTISSSTWG